MKFLFDFFPILLFFGVFKAGERNPEGQHRIASEILPGFLPGAAIILLALAFNLVGDALRDVLDPTQRGRD